MSGTTTEKTRSVPSEILESAPAEESSGPRSKYWPLFDGRIHRVRLSSVPGVTTYESLRVNFYIMAKRWGLRVRVWNDTRAAGEPAVALQAYLPEDPAAVPPQEETEAHDDGRK